MKTTTHLSNEQSFEKNPTTKQVFIDLACVLGTLIVVKTSLLKIPAMWTFAGPISLLCALAMATWRLSVAKQNWKTLGLMNDVNTLKLVLWTLAALVSTMLIGNVVGSLAEQFLADPNIANSELNRAMSGRFADLPGNVSVYLFWLITAWVIGGFTEELLFRGFMIQRFEKLYQQLPFAIGLAVVTQALIFGQQHYYYQGLAGVAAMCVIAIISGVIYVLAKRRLWPLIISHGLANTIGLTMLLLSENS